MLLVTAVLYPTLRRYKDMFIHVIAPLITLFLYGCIAHVRGNVSAASIWMGYVYVGILRAFAGMSLGCICYEVVRKFKQFRMTRQVKVILTIVEFVAYIVPLFAMQYIPYSELDFIIVFVFAIAVTISLSLQSYSPNIIRNAPEWVSQLGLAIFLCHGALIEFTNRLLPEYELHQRLPYFIIFSLLESLVCMWCGNVLKRWFAAHKETIFNLLVERDN